MGENDVGDMVVGRNDVGGCGFGGNDVMDVVVGGNDVGEVVVCGNGVGDVIMGANDVGDVFMGGNDVGDGMDQGPIASPDVEYEHGDVNKVDIEGITLEGKDVMAPNSTTLELGAARLRLAQTPKPASLSPQAYLMAWKRWCESKHAFKSRLSKLTSALNKIAKDATYGLTLVHNDMKTMQLRMNELVERIESSKVVVRNFLDHFNPLLARYEYQLHEREKCKAWMCRFQPNKVNLD
ncbi:hypothetical protein Sjap_002725 [Stephania japonica]|uniref:Uncharacterized protein n=1 Tax=Stephania japonica TaxID=461633 RepID=A0AAP0PUE2_9MAGN